MNPCSYSPAFRDRFLTAGFALWLAGTVVVRLAPAGLLQSDRAAAIVTLYAASFFVTLALIRWRMRAIAHGDAAAAVIALVLPTLVLDAFSSAFFPTVFPNLPAGAAGLFGGWMLVCCGGALAAVLGRR